VLWYALWKAFAYPGRHQQHEFEKCFGMLYGGTERRWGRCFL